VTRGKSDNGPSCWVATTGLTEKLRAELDTQQRHVLKVKSRLKKEKDQWLANCPDRSETMVQLLQNCILPRVVRRCTRQRVLL
jgi:RNA-binding protein YhbY